MKIDNGDHYKLLDRSPMAALGAALDGVAHLARYRASGFGALHAGPLDNDLGGMGGFLSVVTDRIPTVNRNSVGRVVAAALMRESLGVLFGRDNVLGVSEEPPSFRDLVALARSDEHARKIADGFDIDDNLDAALLAADGRPWAAFEVQYGGSIDKARAALDRLGRLAYFTAPFAKGSIGLASLVIVIPEKRAFDFREAIAALATLVESEFGYGSNRSASHGPPFLIRSPNWTCCDGTIQCPETEEPVRSFGAVAISHAYALA